MVRIRHVAVEFVAESVTVEKAYAEPVAIVDVVQTFVGLCTVGIPRCWRGVVHLNGVGVVFE